MKSICKAILAVMLLSSPIFAQNVGVNGTGAAPDASAMLDIAAPDKGLLIPRVALTGTGDVTTVPGSATSLIVYNTATAGNVTPGFYYWNGTMWVRFDVNSDDWSTTGNAGTNPATNFLGTTDAQPLIVRTNNAEQMRVNANGRVGIGETNPSSILHVSNGDVRIGELNPPNTGTFPDFGRRLYFSGGPAGNNYNSDNSDPIWMARYNSASDGSELRMNLTDNCGSPQDNFTIQAGGAGCPLNSVYFVFNAAGQAFKPGGGAWFALSDRRLKKQVRGYSDGLEILKQIRPVRYQYNGAARTPDDGQEYVGVIAQELQEIAPYMVVENGEYLSVDPTPFTYLLINSVKEQQEQIESLQEEKRQLQSEMEELRAEVEAIRQHLGMEARR